jgi:long-chain acyl-CoA synthetase
VAYLPAAHILELVAEHAMLSIGAEIGFADPRTITSRGACRRRPDGSVNTDPGWPYPPGALQEFRPSLLAGVPKIWDIFKKAVEERIGLAPAPVRFVFSVAFSGRASAILQGREAPLFKLLFSRIVQGMVGGRLKIGLTGGGPCSSDVQTFIRTCFCIPFVQGYALTETACAGTVQYLDDNRNGIVGPPLPSVQLRLNDCPEVLDYTGQPYLSTDSVHQGQPCAGRGEVWISGASVSAGYFGEPKKTAEEFVNFQGKRWFKTGDIACWTSDGCLRIVDRLKNLVKLKGGEYIAIEHMEATYGTSHLVDAINGGVLAYGDGDMDRPVAYVQVVPKVFEAAAREQGISYNSVEELVEHPKMEEFALRTLTSVGKKAGLSAIEIIVGVRLFAGTGEKKRAGGPERHDPWTPDNNLLTATNKINRKPLASAFPKLFAELKQVGVRN